MIFIKGNVPSLKNSKVKTSKGIFPSKTVVRYLKDLGVLHYSASRKEVKCYKTKPNLFAEQFKNQTKPNKTVIIEFHFVRNSKHKFDFNNATQIILDLLTAHDLIEDDNMDWVIPFPMLLNEKWYSYDKENAGVYLNFKTI